MHEPRLAPHVDTKAPLLGRVRKRLLFTWTLASVLAGATWLAIPAPPKARPPDLVVAPAAPIVVTVERTIVEPAPPAPPAPPERDLGCPLITGDDRAIGKAVAADQLPTHDEYPPSGLQVVASRRTGYLAVLEEGRALISTDDGATFRPVFADRQVQQIAFDDAGVLYAVESPRLGIRLPSGAERWRDVPLAQCERETCSDRITVAGKHVVWFHDERHAISHDRGRTWKAARTEDAWGLHDGSEVGLFAWNGAVYQVEHYVDRCGIDDSPVWRLDLESGAIAHTIFHNGYPEDGDIALVADDPAAASWRWIERCGIESGKRGPCTVRDATRSAMLAAKTLRPVEGARTLAVDGHTLIELCGNSGRLVHRAFPYDRIDAVDALGRPLIVKDGRVLRWSPRHGWRQLYAHVRSNAGA